MEILLILIYITLFLFGVLSILNGKHKQATFVFLLFATAGMSILPNQAGPLKATHITFILIIVFCFKYCKLIKAYFRMHKESKWIIILSFYFLLSIIVSIFYRFPVIECVTTGFRYLIFLSFLVFIPLKKRDFEKLFTIIFYITLITSVIFIIQCFVGEMILPSTMEVDKNEKTAGIGGIYHFGNVPPFTILFIPISIFCKSLIPEKFRTIAPVIFFSVLFLTLFRTLIFSMIFCILMAMFLRRGLSKYVGPLFLLTFMWVIFGGIFVERLTEQNDTASDLSMVLSGKINEADYQAKDGMTLLYRFAWVAERLEYTMGHPIKLLFGLGMISDKKTQNQYYHFKYGLVDKETGEMNQVGTPDIAWGNLLTRFGLVGSAILLAMYFSSMCKYYRNRKYDDLCLVLFVYLFSNLIASFSGTSFSDPLFWPPVFFLFAFANKRIVLHHILSKLVVYDKTLSIAKLNGDKPFDKSPKISNFAFAKIIIQIYGQRYKFLRTAGTKPANKIDGQAQN